MTFMKFIFCVVIVSTSSISNAQLLDFKIESIEHLLDKELENKNKREEKQRYTKAELNNFGLNDADISSYKKKMKTVEGQWWGHLSPMEFLMFASKDQKAKKRFAKMYLKSNYPKVKAERDALLAMKEVSRELVAENFEGIANEINGALEERSKNGPKLAVLFVDFQCEKCKKETFDIVNKSKSKLDIYFTNAPIKNFKNSLINWARSANLPSTKVTLNADGGRYYKRFKKNLIGKVQLLSK